VHLLMEPAWEFCKAALAGRVCWLLCVLLFCGRFAVSGFWKRSPATPHLPAFPPAAPCPARTATSAPRAGCQPACSCLAALPPSPPSSPTLPQPSHVPTPPAAGARDPSLRAHHTGAPPSPLWSAPCTQLAEADAARLVGWCIHCCRVRAVQGSEQRSNRGWSSQQQTS